MKRLIFSVGLLFALLLSITAFGQTPFKDFLARVNRLPNPADKTAVVDSFMHAAVFPYREIDPASPTGYAAYFVYRGSATSVTAPGDFNFWDMAAD
ncbi:MAG: hypothetical protein ACRENG_27205, partial [bacterium]